MVLDFSTLYFLNKYFIPFSIVYKMILCKSFIKYIYSLFLFLMFFVFVHQYKFIYNIVSLHFFLLKILRAATCLSSFLILVE